jgi:putative transposase
LRHALAQFVIHYHRERNHQGLGNELIDGVGFARAGAAIRRQPLGGLLSYYHRAA